MSDDTDHRLSSDHPAVDLLTRQARRIGVLEGTLAAALLLHGRGLLTDDVIHGLTAVLDDETWTR